MTKKKNQAMNMSVNLKRQKNNDCRESKGWKYYSMRNDWGLFLQPSVYKRAFFTYSGTAILLFNNGSLKMVAAFLNLSYGKARC